MTDVVSNRQGWMSWAAVRRFLGVGGAGSE